MDEGNYVKLDNIILVTWVDKALKQSFTNYNIKSRFKVCIIWPLNSKAMAHRIGPLNMINNKEVEEDYNLHDGINEN